MTVARHDRESCDLRIAHNVIDLLPLGIGSAVIVGPADPVSVGGPGILHHSGGKVLHIHPIVESSERISPDLPRRLRLAQRILEPRLLLDAEDGPQLLIFSRVWNANIAELKFGGRLVDIGPEFPIPRHHNNGRLRDIANILSYFTG